MAAGEDGTGDSACFDGGGMCGFVNAVGEAGGDDEVGFCERGDEFFRDLFAVCGAFSRSYDADVDGVWVGEGSRVVEDWGWVVDLAKKGRIFGVGDFDGANLSFVECWENCIWIDVLAEVDEVCGNGWRDAGFCKFFCWSIKGLLHCGKICSKPCKCLGAEFMEFV